jgi:hypothetical protein
VAETKPAAQKEVVRTTTQEAGTVRQVTTAETLTETGPVTYNPGPGEQDVTRVFGMLFRAGESVQVDDPRAYAKLRTHPAFQDKSAKGEDRTKRQQAEREKIDKELDGRTKEARKLRDEALAKTSEAEAAERARQALADAADDDEERINLGRSR